MDDRQQRQVNEAAEKFAAAIRESFEAVAERGVSAQQLNAELTQSFFNNVIDNLRAQTEANRALTRSWPSSKSARWRPRRWPRRTPSTPTWTS